VNALIREHGQGRHRRPALARKVDQRRGLRDELFAPAAVTVVLAAQLRDKLRLMGSTEIRRGQGCWLLTFRAESPC
jgi:hypothetical protein